MEAQMAKQQREIQEEILALERQLFNACMWNDAAALERLLADDYVSTNHDGTFIDREQVIESVRNQSFTMERVETEGVTVRLYRDTAIVTGSAQTKVSLNDHPAEGEFRYTEVWIKQNDQWRAVAWQGTPIAAQ